jgi:hypothetical protein
VHQKAGVECITCHESIYDAKTLAGAFLPKEDTCLQCHKEKKTAGQCQFCHTDARYAAPWPELDPHLKFDHAAHIERVKEDCTACHAQLSEPGRPVPLSGGHAACTKCHGHADQYADAQCTACHVDLIKYPLVPASDPSHLGDFLRRHSSLAPAATKACGACHDQNFCLDCHARTAMVPIETLLIDRPDRRFIHQGDYLGRHPVEARADPASCQRCHAVSDCETCHARERISAGTGGTNPHPSTWMLPGTNAFHGDAARRDIESCASCHDQGDRSNCVQCHKVGGPGGDPHPPGYGSHHHLSDAATDGRCAACHL